MDSYEGMIAYGLFQQPCENSELAFCPVDIALVNPISGETTILNVGFLDPGIIQWSPNFDRLSYWRGGHIYVVDPVTEEVVDIMADDGWYGYYEWSPDGEQIAVLSDSLVSSEFYIVDIDSLERETINTDFPILHAPFDWSPDGAYITFASSTQPSDIYLVSVDGTDQINLTQHPADDGDPSWSADGSQLAFVSDRDGATQIYAMDLETDTVRQLTMDDARLKGGPEWIWDDSHIVYYAFDESGDVYLAMVNVETLEIAEIVRYPPATIGGYDISQDETQTAVVYGVVGETNLCVINLNDLTERCLDVPMPDRNAVPAWGS